MTSKEDTLRKRVYPFHKKKCDKTENFHSKPF